MILSFISMRAGAVVAALVTVAGCARSGETPTGPASAASTPAVAATSAAAGVADVIGALKLVRQEYANAVAPEGGSVVDATEYAETELFAEQAQTKFAALADGGTAGDDAHRAGIRDGIARVQKAVGDHAPPPQVANEVGRTLALAQELLAGAVPEEIRGAVVTTARADEAVAAEEIVGEYRVGVASGPAKQIFLRRDGALVATPAAPGAVYLGVLLRERRTKRLLPASTVTATLARDGATSDVALAELWGDFHQYGANVALPGDGPLTITVHASAPAYARHGDMLTHFVTPVSATFAARVQEGALRFDAHPVQPVDADYAVGDDVLQARTEAGTLHDAGPYRIGVIVEGPEPIWTWHDGAPVLAAVAADATNHVEVALLDRESGVLVPDARVTLTFLGGGATPLGTATLQPLLSVFSHYGATLAVPTGATRVHVHVDPPTLGAIDRPRLAGSADIDVDLPARRGTHA